jgi:hypothetical protein
MVSPERAKRTIQLTTQRGVCTCLNPTLAQRFPTNDRMLRYKRLPHTTFTDTMFAGMPSRSGNKCAQVYSTSFGWASAHPMTRKGEAHVTLSLLFHRDGVPPAMVLDGSKEQCLGDFKRKLRKADCHLRQTKPYSPWQQAAKGCIRMMGIPLTGPSYIYWDNKSQVTNSSRPELTLKKKCNSICYHAIQESVAMGESLITHIKTDDKLSDFLTKMTSGAKRCKLVSGVVHDIYDDFPKQ